MARGKCRRFLPRTPHAGLLPPFWLPISQSVGRIAGEGGGGGGCGLYTLHPIYTHRPGCAQHPESHPHGFPKSHRLYFRSPAPAGLVTLVAVARQWQQRQSQGQPIADPAGVLVVARRLLAAVPRSRVPLVRSRTHHNLENPELQYLPRGALQRDCRQRRHAGRCLPLWCS